MYASPQHADHASVLTTDDDTAPASSIYSADDPLALPVPARETTTERNARLAREAEARRVSSLIDAEIKREKRQRRKGTRDVKLLLLGQAESGKSTLLKQFQLAFDPEGIERTRASWRPVVLHNVAWTVRTVLNVLETYDDTFDGAPGTPDTAFGAAPPPLSPSVVAQRAGFQPNPPRTVGQQEIAMLRMRLSPVVSAVTPLAERLGSPATPRLPVEPAPVKVAANGQRKVSADALLVQPGWQERATSPAAEAKRDLVDVTASVLRACRDDVFALWEHPTVRALIVRKRIRFDDWADYFAIAVDRVSAADYVPTIEDVLHARCRTIGVEEHTLLVPQQTGSMAPLTWRIYDVGGARNQRQAWVPYFDDASAVIFLAPVSAFDQWLDEEPDMNRLDDSMKLFDWLCSNPMLRKAGIVLFLNKVDVLAKKLAAGIRVAKYITSFADRPNETGPVLDYFRSHFSHTHRRRRGEGIERKLYCHYTTVVDRRQTAGVIMDVKDSIVRENLSSAGLT